MSKILLLMCIKAYVICGIDLEMVQKYREKNGSWTIRDGQSYYKGINTSDKECHAQIYELAGFDKSDMGDCSLKRAELAEVLEGIKRDVIEKEAKKTKIKFEEEL